MNILQLAIRSLPPTLSSITVALLFILMLAGTGCSRSTEIRTHAAGHPIRASVQGEHTVESHAEQGVIASPFGTVTIERGRIRVEGAPWATIPEGVVVKVSISKSKVRVNAGRVTVVRTVG